jgi:NADH:ubiquinone oxidoreductase subunit C
MLELAIDVGYSSTKVKFQGKLYKFPSAISFATDLGIDYGEELGVIYHLESSTKNHMIEMKVKTADRENPNFDTVSDIWPAAYLNEDEVYDFFGIKFNGHKNLRRIFMDENWKGWPLRKDYKDDLNMLTR